MTSSAPQGDWFLEVLRRAGDESCPPLGADRLHEIAEARRMTPTERLATLNEIMLLAEATRNPCRVEVPVVCGALRL
jgi:hypothetical protein